MASGSGPGDVLQASEGKTRFVRLSRLLVCGGTTVMKELFNYIIPPANLAAVLSNPAVKTRLTDMKNKRILTSPQWQKLYPPPGGGSVQSTSFDITLLFKLLRENMISGLLPPSKGWDKLPNVGDFSLPADMARIKYYRNGIAHGDEKMELSEQEFSDYWKEIKDALVRIVGYYATSGSSTVRDWETAINGLLTDPLTEDDRRNVDELKSWYLDDSRDLNKMIGSIDSRLENLERRDLERGNLQRQENKKFIVRCVARIAGVGAWLGGTIYVLDRLKDNPDVLIDYVTYSIIPTGLAFVSFAFGCIKITMRVETLDALDEILKRYRTGQLKDDFNKVLITEELKTLANGERIELGVEINEEELMAIRKLLAEEKAIEAPDGKEVNVAVSSRALFELEEEHDVFEKGGSKKYVELQITREETFLKPGSAFPFIQALEYVNTKLLEENPDEKEIFAITLMSHNSGQVGIRLQKSIEHYGLKVKRIALTSGSSMVPYLKPYEITLFLTSYEEEVTDALKEGFAAAVMSLQPAMNSPDETQLRIAFDLDVVLYADENKEQEDEYALDTPLNEGPLKKFAEAIGRMQKKLRNEDPCPIRTYIVSSRDAMVGSRALITLRNWGLEIDESHFMGGRPTDELVKIINPHIYFNSKDADVESARAKGTPTGHVKHRECDEKKKEEVKKDLFKNE